MEITFSQQQDFCLELKAKQIKELAEHLNLTVPELKALVRGGDLYDEYAGELTTWLNGRVDQAQVTNHEDVEIDEISL